MTTREEKAKQRALKRKKQKLVIFFTVFVLIIVGVLAALGLILNKVTPDELATTEPTTANHNTEADDCYNSLVASAMVLKESVFEDVQLENTVKKELGAAYSTSLTVFLSFSDGKTAAHTVHASAPTLEQAWEEAVQAAGDRARSVLCAPVYVKADIVNHVERVSSAELSSRISAEAGIYGEYFRKGIAFDGAFSSALLEAQINANELIDYDIAKNLVLDKVNLYLSANGGTEIAKMPENLYLFTCRGYIKDAEGCHALVYDQTTSYGRREMQTVDYATVTGLASSVSQYLLANMAGDGKFTYGTYPTIGLPIEKYDTGYHAMALSALSVWAKAQDSAGLSADSLKHAAAYLKTQIVEKDDRTAFAVNADTGEITAGACAQSIVAFLDYEEAVRDSQYAAAAEKLGNGLVSMMDAASGKPNHVLFYKSSAGADFAVKTAQSDRTFDSAAVYALCRLYGKTNQETFLTAARTIADAMIKENYAQYGDCYVSVAMEELTKYDKSAEYFNLALKNFNDNIQALESRVISMPQYTRLLVSTYRIYSAMQSEKITTELFSSFDHDRLVTACVARANDLLNAIAWPEISMYFREPDACTNAFFVRQDGFRIRIDDMASFIRAYSAYAEVYTAVSADAFNVAAKQAAAASSAAGENNG